MNAYKALGIVQDKHSRSINNVREVFLEFVTTYFWQGPR